MNEINKLFSDDKRKTVWAALLFLFFVVLFEAYALKISYSEYFVNLFDTQDFISATVVVLCIAFSFYLSFLFILFAFSSSWINKTLCFFLFVAAVLVEFTFQKALGRFSDFFDVQNVFATNTEQRITSLLIYLNFKSLIPCIIFLLCLIFFKSKSYRQSWQHLLLTCGLFTLFFVSISQFGSFFIEKKFPTLALNAFSRTSADFALWGIFSSDNLTAIITGEDQPRNLVKKPSIAENYRPANNIIFVVDESVIGSHLSLNGYQRPTTPFLDDLLKKEILHNWNIASSASTGSLHTHKMLLAGIAPEDLPDKTSFKINKYPTFFQYAKAMRYKTHYFDGQMKQYWSGVGDDTNYIDNWVGSDQIGDAPTLETWEVDNQIARQVKEVIDNSTGNFIFINKRGSHISYQKNFPPSETLWYPSYRTNKMSEIPDAEQLTEVTNAYDNSLRYNINNFFKILIDDYTQMPNNTIIVYTGDHGQTLFADGKASHGGATKIEADVPLFIIGKLGKDVDTGYKAAHQNIFPTLLDLMDFPKNLRERNIVPSLLEARASDSKPRFFNPNLGEKVPFD